MIRRISNQERAQGYLICECGKFATIWRADMMRRLPKGYSGELCPECGLWMCAVDKMRQAGMLDSKMVTSRSAANVLADYEELQRVVLVKAQVIRKAQGFSGYVFEVAKIVVQDNTVLADISVPINEHHWVSIKFPVAYLDMNDQDIIATEQGEE